MAKRKKRILITGFESFGKFSYNPSWDSIEDLDKRKISGFELLVRRLPVSFDSHLDLKRFVKDFSPDIVLSLGMDGRAKVLKIETIARGKKGKFKERFTNIPADKMIQKLKDKFHVQKNEDAGGYVCDHIFWHNLGCLKSKNNVKLAGFIHVPFVVRKNMKELQLKIILIIKEVIKYYKSKGAKNAYS